MIFLFGKSEQREFVEIVELACDETVENGMD